MLGLGYVGLPTALSLTNQGRRVLGVDISERRLAAIRSGEVDVLDDDRPASTTPCGPAFSN